MNRVVLLFTALLLCACSQNARELRLQDVDLSDWSEIAKLGAQLSPAERSALMMYAAIHSPGSAGFCGQPLVDAEGNEPETVGNAIDLTLASEARFRTASGEGFQRASPAEEISQQLDRLIDQRELVIHRQSMLLAEHGSAAAQLPEWGALQVEMTAYDETMKTLRRQIEALSS